MKKQTIYIASLEEVLEGEYYEVRNFEDYEYAVEDFMEKCKERNLSDDLEIQYIDGELTGEATDYIEEVLKLAGKYKVDLQFISALFKVASIDGGEIEEILANKNYFRYPLTIREYSQTKEDAFREYLEETGYLSEVPEYFRDYLDYEKLLNSFESGGLDIIKSENEYIIVY